jgi:hypothetical protein
VGMLAARPVLLSPTRVSETGPASRAIRTSRP